MENIRPNLIDPETKTPVRHDADADAYVSEQGIKYPVIKGVARFVGSDNYAQAFGDQWLRFPKTQLDSATGIPVSETRLARCLRTSLDDFLGKLVLEAG